MRQRTFDRVGHRVSGLHPTVNPDEGLARIRRWDLFCILLLYVYACASQHEARWYRVSGLHPTVDPDEGLTRIRRWDLFCIISLYVYVCASQHEALWYRVSGAGPLPRSKHVLFLSYSCHDSCGAPRSASASVRPSTRRTTAHTTTAATIEPEDDAPAEPSRATPPHTLSPPTVRGLHKDAALGRRSHSRVSRRGGGTLSVGPKRPESHYVYAEWLGVAPQRPLSACHTPGKRNDQPSGSRSHGKVSYPTGTIFLC